MRQQIIRFVKRYSNFNHDSGNDTEEVLAFSNRENGDMMCDEHSEIDWSDGEQIKKKLLNEFSGITVELEPCDEWVLLDVIIKS